VSPESVYATFSSKRELLAQMIAVSISGADEAVPMLQRGWVETMRRLPGCAERLRYWIGHTCETLERTSQIHALIHGAVISEPALAGLRRQHQEFRLRVQTRLMGLIEEGAGAPLRRSIAKSAQTFWALASPELHRLLRVDRGWSKTRYRDWLTDALETLIWGAPVSGSGNFADLKRCPLSAAVGAIVDMANLRVHGLSTDLSCQISTVQYRFQAQSRYDADVERRPRQVRVDSSHRTKRLPPWPASPRSFDQEPEHSKRCGPVYWRVRSPAHCGAAASWRPRSRA
jgi:hypothetical protein